MKGLVYELLSVGLIGCSLFFFYQCTVFLTGKDYLAATLAMLIGFAVARVSVELARLAVILRKGE